MSILQSLTGWISGEENAGVGVPVFDGVFKPNATLDEAETIAVATGADALAVADGVLYCSAGNDLLEITFSRGKAKTRGVKNFPSAITFMATNKNDLFAIGTEVQGLFVGPLDALKKVELASNQQSCLTAGTFTDDETLYVCVGSTHHAAADWKRDLMTATPSGQVIKIDVAGLRSSILAQNLSFPNGIVHLPNGKIAVSESWRHRVLSLEQDGSITPLLPDLPAYPSRMQPSVDGGFWLSLFAPRRQLFEFILQEAQFRLSMLSDVDPAEWVGPELSSSIAPDQPMTKGLVRQMGILKPWAPSQSYGLIAKCSAKGNVERSYHSRADGTFHGITDVCEMGGNVYFISKGAGKLLRLPAETLHGNARP